MATPDVIAGAPLGTSFQGPIRVLRNHAHDPATAPPLLTTLPFFKANLTTNQTASAFNFGAADVTTLTMPKSGSLLGFSVDVSAAVSAGSYGIRVQKNGANVGGIFTVATQTAVTLTRFTSNLTSVTYARGDKFKVLGTSSTDITANLDFGVMLWVV